MLFENIRRWADDRSLIEGSTPQAQLAKLLEEAGELASGIAKRDTALVRDSIGDLAVVLTILAAQHGWNIQDCIQEAYDEIKDRRGVLLDGIFVKERDLIHPDLTKKLDTLVERYHEDGQAYIADWADGNAPIAIINNLLRQRGVPADHIEWERDGHEWSLSLRTGEPV